jgi:hypothetical protein
VRGQQILLSVMLLLFIRLCCEGCHRLNAVEGVLEGELHRQIAVRGATLGPIDTPAVKV